MRALLRTALTLPIPLLGAAGAAAQAPSSS